MESLIITWLAAALFVLMVFWGTNVPSERRTPVVYFVLGLIVAYNLFAHAYLFGNLPRGSGPAALQAAESSGADWEAFLSRTTLTPQVLRDAPPMAWYRVVTSSLLHSGWLHFLFNAWFFVLFGSVLERVLGSKKFAAIVSAGLIIPATLEGCFPALISTSARYTGGFSGVVYAVMGAYVICFPRSKVYGAFCYDLRYWAAILFLLLPMTMVTRYAGPALTEMVIMLGMLGLFLVIQPEHLRVSVPVIVVIFYKLVQDLALIEPVAEKIIGNSFWRIAGGFIVGGVMGLLLNGTRGWKQTWDDETKNHAPAKRSNGRTSVAQLEAEGHKSIEGARIFLGQRVFVGDAVRAATFYSDVVVPRFPDLVLPLQEQMALARLLHFKGCESEALHAYENLLRADALPEEHWIAWLKAAEYVAKLAPERSADALQYLDRFEEGNSILMRDRIEAERLRAALPAESAETAAVVAAAEDPPPLAVGGGALKGNIELLKEGLDFPKVTPRTFHYNPGGETVNLGFSASKKKDLISLPNGDGFTAYWRPLPCVSENKPLPSILDRPVKSQQFVEEAGTDRDSMYGIMKGVRGYSKSGGGRLSRLELMRKEAISRVPAVKESRSQYGGLEDFAKEGEDARPVLRLRGEKEPPARVESRRSRMRGQSVEKPGLNWGRMLAPGDQMPADKGGYGDSTGIGEVEEKDDSNP